MKLLRDKYFLLGLLLMVAGAAVWRHGRLASLAGPDAEANDSALVSVGDYNDRYDQRHTEACWVYAMLACIEHEAARVGDDVRLSRQWLMAQQLRSQAVRRYEALHGGGGETDDDAAELSMRGVGADVIELINTYGMVPYEQERSAVNNSKVLERRLMQLTDGDNVTRDRLADGFRRLLPRIAVVGQTDGYGDAASHFYYLSMEYTARQFAESVMYRQHWTFYQVVRTDADTTGSRVYDVRDNRRRHAYRCVRATDDQGGELLAMVRRSLSAGHPVYWEYCKDTGDVTDGGVLESNHAMAVVGVRKGQFLCLNSYGSKWGKNGYCLVSPKFFAEYTSSIGLVEN